MQFFYVVELHTSYLPEVILQSFNIILSQIFFDRKTNPSDAENTDNSPLSKGLNLGPSSPKSVAFAGDFGGGARAGVIPVRI